jgi:DNA-binding transcriptional MerR regulator
MTNAFRLFSEQESARFAGVSPETIRQYEKYGLLSSVKKDGDAFYKEVDLRSIFNLSNTPQSLADLQRSSASGDSPDSNTTAKAAAAAALQSEKKAEQANELLDTQNSPVEEPAVAEKIEKNEFTRTSIDSTNTQQQAEAEQPALNASIPNGPSGTEKIAEKEHKNSDFGSITFTEPGKASTFELLELSRSLRDQIQMLKEERDWLRKRVENLEARTERDQMLLISESSTVRTLIEQAPKRRSFWSFALPWLGEKPRQ